MSLICVLISVKCDMFSFLLLLIAKMKGPSTPKTWRAKSDGQLGLADKPIALLQIAGRA
jgi:hypothetical protein